MFQLFKRIQDKKIYGLKIKKEKEKKRKKIYGVLTEAVCRRKQVAQVYNRKEKVYNLFIC